MGYWTRNQLEFGATEGPSHRVQECNFLVGRGFITHITYGVSFAVLDYQHCQRPIQLWSRHWNRLSTV